MLSTSWSWILRTRTDINVIYNFNLVASTNIHPLTLRNRRLRKPPLQNLRIFSNLSNNNNAINDGLKNNEGKRKLQQTKGRKRVNQKAREIMSLLNDRYDSISPNEKTAPSEWSKAQTYIYKATMDKSKDPLTVKEVQLVLDFLDEKFGVLTKTIVQSCPRILRRNVQSHLLPTVEFLEELYGSFQCTVVEESSQNDNMLNQALSRNPSLLLTSGVGFRPTSRKDQKFQSNTQTATTVEDFFRDEIGLKDAQIQKLAKSCPSVFSFPVDTRIQPILEYLSSLLYQTDSSSTKIQTLNNAGIKKVILSSPRILSLSLEKNIKPKVEYLRKRCGLTTKHLAVLLKSCPGILGLSVTNNLEPFITYLESILERDNQSNDQKDIRIDLHKSLCRHPQLLALSIENIQSKVDYFDCIDTMDETNSMSSKSLARRILMSAPSVYSLSLEDNIVPTIQCLASLWGFSKSFSPQPRKIQNKSAQKFPKHEDSNKDVSTSLTKRIAEYPIILTLSLEGNINPTLSFYESAGYITLNDETDKQKSSEDPDNNEDSTEKKRNYTKNLNFRGRHVAASLYNRLLPRWHYFQERGNKDDSLPLHLLATSSDKDFCEQLDFDEQHFNLFKKEKGPALKFNSQFATWVKTGRPIDTI